MKILLLIIFLVIVAIFNKPLLEFSREMTDWGDDILDKIFKIK